MNAPIPHRQRVRQVKSHVLEALEEKSPLPWQVLHSSLGELGHPQGVVEIALFELLKSGRIADGAHGAELNATDPLAAIRELIVALKCAAESRGDLLAIEDSVMWSIEVFEIVGQLFPNEFNLELERSIKFDLYDLLNSTTPDVRSRIHRQVFGVGVILENLKRQSADGDLVSVKDLVAVHRFLDPSEGKKAGTFRSVLLGHTPEEIKGKHYFHYSHILSTLRKDDRVKVVAGEDWPETVQEFREILRKSLRPAVDS